MLEILLNKFLIITFFLAVFNVIRHIYYFIQAFVSSNEEQPSKYIISEKSLVILGLSLAYVVSVFFTGITI
jgi:hypothetical protein